MATIAELAQKLRVERVAEDSVNYFDTDQLESFIVDASREIAAVLGFPRVTTTQAGAVGDVAITAPTGMLELHQLSFDGVAIRPRTLPYIRFFQGLPQSRWPRGWSWDETRGTTVLTGPPLGTAGTWTLDYTKDPYDGTDPANTTEVWQGEYERFHDVVLLKAHIKAIEMGGELTEELKSTVERYMAALQEFQMVLERSRL